MTTGSDGRCAVIAQVFGGLLVTAMIGWNARTIWLDARKGRAPVPLAAFACATYALLAWVKPWASFVFFICAMVLFMGGGHWLKRRAKQIASSLTAVQTSAFRRDVAGAR
jgi:cation transport ATPase